MAFTSKWRFARITARKARLLTDLIRNKPVGEALDLLKFNKKRGAIMVAKVLKSAVANGTVIKAAVLALGTCADLETEQFFRDNNITTSQYQIVVLSDPYQEAALRSGEIDIAVLHPPFYTAAEQHGGVTILTTSEAVAGPTAGASLLVFTDAFIQAHPDAVAAYIKAYKAAEQWSDDHVIQSGILTAKTIGLTSAKSHWYS